MPEQHHYRLVRPCADCPFRADRPFHLRAGRVADIEHGTRILPFTCHNTLDEGCEREHCAGP